MDLWYVRTDSDSIFRIQFVWMGTAVGRSMRPARFKVDSLECVWMRLAGQDLEAGSGPEIPFSVFLNGILIRLSGYWPRPSSRWRNRWRLGASLCLVPNQLGKILERSVRMRAKLAHMSASSGSRTVHIMPIGNV